jgi:hypothetical protein
VAGGPEDVAGGPVGEHTRLVVDVYTGQDRFGRPRSQASGAGKAQGDECEDAEPGARGGQESAFPGRRPMRRPQIVE